MQHDPLLLSAVAFCAAVIGFQLGMTLVRPPWAGAVTDVLRAALAWPQLFVVVYVSVWLSREHRREALSWWMCSAALLSYAIARTLWSLADLFIYHHGVPFPILPDLFFVLQYPFFFLMVICIPRTRVWGPRLILVLDGLLWMGAAAALSWQFLLGPIFMVSGLSPLAREVSMAYPVGDLLILVGLTMTLLRPSRYEVDRLVVCILIAAFACLILGDTLAIWLILHPSHVYRTGGVADLFWVAFYLLLPLAALVQLRLAQRASLWQGGGGQARQTQRLGWGDFLASLRFSCPFVAALLVSGVILVRAAMQIEHVGWRSLMAPLAVSFGLLLLVIVRQQVMSLEHCQLRREREVARANELAQRELNRRKDEFLGIVSHELKTPLTSLQGYMTWLTRRFVAWRQMENGGADGARGAEQLHRQLAHASTVLASAMGSLQRITRLVDDLLDDAHVRDGQLTFRLAPCNLGTVVTQAVEEQRSLVPERTIHLEVPAEPVLVLADADRIAQVVTNYLTNALKYSREEQPVTVQVEAEADRARVIVRNEGASIPLPEQARVWERFHRIPGIEVQSGSGVSLGIGLHVSKGIIERHSGAVGVESAPGQGSTFWFTLPLIHPSTTACSTVVE